MKKLRILALVHKHLVPPQDTMGVDVVNAEWKMEFDVTVTLEGEGHEILVAGVHDDLTPIRSSVDEFKPDIVFNLLEGFADINTFDQNVVSFLELLRIPYTGCNPRGLILARDKSPVKLLTYHRVPSRLHGSAAWHAVRPTKLRFPHREVAGLRGVDRHLAGLGRRNHEQLARRVQFVRAWARGAGGGVIDASSTWASSATSGCAPSRCGRCPSPRCPSGRGTWRPSG
jgi:hypothetical protein